MATKEEIYDSQVTPLMTQILDICKEHKINMTASFALDKIPETNRTRFCTSSLRLDEEDIEGFNQMTIALDIFMFKYTMIGPFLLVRCLAPSPDAIIAQMAKQENPDV